MLGAIRKRDVIAHPLVTIRCFGWRVFLQALVASPNQTFLALVMKSQVQPDATVNVPALLGRCVELERTAQRIYGTLAERFADPDPVRKFLLTLSHQEQGHAELLQVCRAAVGRGSFDAKRFSPWRHAVPQLEHDLLQVESSLDEVSTRSQALRCVMDIESSEINRVFLGVVSASDTEFVQRLKVFKNTGQKHLRFIAERLTALEPGLASVCREMVDAYEQSQ